MRTIILAAAAALGVFLHEDFLTGRWETKPSEKGNVTSVLFEADQTFEGYINKKPFVTGQYTLRDSIMSFVDNGCDGAEGVYKVVLFHYGDSLRFEPLNDICEERKNGMSRLVMGRLK